MLDLDPDIYATCEVSYDYEISKHFHNIDKTFLFAKYG